MQIDLVGEITPPNEGHAFIFTLVDVFTGFTVLRPLKNREMITVTRVLWEIICLMGPMRILQSDHGTEFVNSMLKKLCAVYGIDKRVITPYNPRANGLVERQNKEIVVQLQKHLARTMERWCEWLPFIQLCLNVRYLDRVGAIPSI